MAFYKLDGAKFPTMDELREAMWEIYQEKMSKEEFEKYLKEKVEVIE
jgi:hypothetical protein